MEKQTPKGILKYRMPNILEAYDLLEASGVSEKTGILKMKKNIIKEMHFLIDHSAICESYDELLNMTDEMFMPLSEIADEVVIKTFEVFKKKT